MAPRTNGWQAPFHPYQIAAYVLFAFFEGAFHALTAPALPGIAFYIVVAIHAAALITMVYAVVATTTHNAMDPLPAAAHARVLAGGAPDSQATPVSPDACWCPFCRAWVDQTSKHCKLCDKCVDNFDHHCKYLNNCIGGQNYRLFLLSIGAALCCVLIELGTCIATLVLLSTDPAAVGVALSRYYTQIAASDINAVCGVLCAFLLLATLALGHLSGLHVWLIRNNLTTFEWIIQNRMREEEEQQRAKQQELELQKTAAAAAAASASTAGTTPAPPFSVTVTVNSSAPPAAKSDARPRINTNAFTMPAAAAVVDFPDLEATTPRRAAYLREHSSTQSAIVNAEPPGALNSSPAVAGKAARPSGGGDVELSV